MKLHTRMLWDLLPKRVRDEWERRTGRFVEPTPPASPPRKGKYRQNKRKSMREKYDELVVEMKSTYGFRVRKWRTSTTGCAWQVHYHDGSTIRLIESPYPTGPMSCAVFLHEVGHHAIGFGVYRPRCLEEFKAWEWAIKTMRDKGLNVTEAVEKRFVESMKYALAKARRRGLKRVPPELLPYL